MKVFKNYLYNVGYQLLVIIVPLITTPYINRVLGPYGVGINTYTNTIIQYFILFGGMGIALYGNRQIAYVRDNPFEKAKTFWEIQTIHVVGILGASIVFYIYLLLFAHYKWYMIVQFINLIAAAFDVSWFFQGIEDFKVTVLRNTVVKIISIILVFTCIHNSKQTATYIFIYALASLIGNLTLWPSLKKELKFKFRFSDLRLKRHIVPTLELFIPEVAVQIYQTLNKTILGLIVSTNSAGFYFNSDTIIKMLLGLVTAFSSVMLPHIANQYSQKKIENIKRVTYLTYNIMTGVSLALVFGIAAISLKFAPIFFGRSFNAVGPALLMESPVIYFAGMSNILGAQYLIPTNQTNAYSLSLIIGAIGSIICNFLLIPIFHLSGAIVSTVIAEFLVYIYQLYFVVSHKQLRARTIFEGSLKYLLAGITMFVCVFAIDRKTGNSIMWIAIEIIVGIIIYIMMLVVLRTRIALLAKQYKKIVNH